MFSWRYCSFISICPWMLDHVYAPHENVVAYEGNFFDSIFPLPCSFFNFLNLEGFPMRNTLSITNVLSGCKGLGENKRICIFFLQTGLLSTLRTGEKCIHSHGCHNVCLRTRLAGFNIKYISNGLVVVEICIHSKSF